MVFFSPVWCLSYLHFLYRLPNTGDTDYVLSAGFLCQFVDSAIQDRLLALGTGWILAGRLYSVSDDYGFVFYFCSGVDVYPADRKKTSGNVFLHFFFEYVFNYSALGLEELAYA